MGVEVETVVPQISQTEAVSQPTSLLRQLSNADWLPVLVFLVLTRLLLNIPAYLGANVWPLRIEVIPPWTDVTRIPGLWVRWDSGFYITIASQGYSYNAPELAFFPLYPLMIRIISLGNLHSMTWVAFLLSNLAFVLACLLLWQQTKHEFDIRVAWSTIITLSVFPTSFFFTAVYAESLFLLLSILVYLLSARKKYLMAAIVVSLVSITRLPGLALAVIPVVEALLEPKRRSWRLAALVGIMSVLGLISYSMYLWPTQGSPVAFIAGQNKMLRFTSWPWQSYIDSLLVATTGYGGNIGNWFMRATSTAEVLTASVFIICALVAFIWLRKSLAFYSVAALLVLLTAHGPYALGLFSITRYVIVIFPCFIVLGIVLTKLGKLKWFIWAISYALLWFLTAWFANGRWVA